MKDYESGKYEDTFTDEQKISTFEQISKTGAVSYFNSMYNLFFSFRLLNFLNQKLDNIITFHKLQLKTKELIAQLMMEVIKHTF